MRAYKPLCSNYRGISLAPFRPKNKRIPDTYLLIRYASLYLLIRYVSSYLLYLPRTFDPPSGLDQNKDFWFPISWLAEANSPLLDEKWRKFQTWIWSDPDGWWLHSSKHWSHLFERYSPHRREAEENDLIEKEYQPQTFWQSSLLHEGFTITTRNHAV